MTFEQHEKFRSVNTRVQQRVKKKGQMTEEQQLNIKKLIQYAQRNDTFRKGLESVADNYRESLCNDLNIAQKRGKITSEVFKDGVFVDEITYTGVVLTFGENALEYPSSRWSDLMTGTQLFYLYGVRINVK